MRKRFPVWVLVASLCLALSAVASENDDWQEKVSFFGEVDFRMNSYTLSYERGSFTVFDDDGNPTGVEKLDDLSTTDFYIYWAQFGTQIVLNDFVSGQASVIWEEVEFDSDSQLEPTNYEAFIKIKFPLLVTPYVTMGHLMLPVGQNDTFTITDSLVTELTETWKTSLGIGVEHKYFDFSFWIYNGAVDLVESDGEPLDNMIDEFLLRLSVAPPLLVKGRIIINFGAYWMWDSMETDMDLMNRLDLQGNYKDSNWMFGFYMTYIANITDMVGIGLITELAQTDKFRKKNYTDNSGDTTQIRTLNGELAVLLFQQVLRVGARYELIQGLDYLGTQGYDPEYEVTQYSAVSGFMNAKWDNHVEAGLQYKYGFDDEDNVDHTFAMQVKLGF